MALIEALNKAKPATSKGVYLRKVAVSSTMGLGVRVDTQIHLGVSRKKSGRPASGAAGVVGCRACKGTGRPSKTVGAQATALNRSSQGVSQRRWRSR